jgi:hypothetical protein
MAIDRYNIAIFRMCSPFWYCFRTTLFIIYLTGFLKIIIRIAALSRKNKGKKKGGGAESCFFTPLVIYAIHHTDNSRSLLFSWNSVTFCSINSIFLRKKVHYYLRLTKKDRHMLE